jgi:FkbM family methyltransferase
VIQAGAGAAKGQLKLYFDRSDDFTTAATVLKGSGQQDEVLVDMVSLQELLASQKWDHVDFLKLDCEGSEYDVLYSAPDTTLDSIQRMAIETHPGDGPDQNQQALEKFLHGKGFETASLRSKLWAWRPLRAS